MDILRGRFIERNAAAAIKRMNSIPNAIVVLVIPYKDRQAWQCITKPSGENQHSLRFIDLGMPTLLPMPKAARRNRPGDRTMTSTQRSLSGAALMLVLIPIFAGLLACMPVPIGDPERSRIDPEMTGIWAMLFPEEAESVGFYVFEPYDKRTWLIMEIEILGGDAVDLDKYDFASYEGYENLASNEKVHVEHVHADDVALYKAWHTKLRGEPFFTWEPKGRVDSLGEDPEFWIVYHIAKKDKNTMELRMVNGDAEPFDGIDKTRRAYERVLKKHVHDPVIYGEDDDEEYRITLKRAEGPVLEFLEEVAGLVFAD